MTKERPKDLTIDKLWEDWLKKGEELNGFCRKIDELESENARLTNLAQEGRKAGLEEAVTRLAETGDFAGANEVRALIPQEPGEKGK